MKVSRNRWVSFYFLVLGLMPIAMFVVLLQYEDLAELWANRDISWQFLVLPVLGLFALVLSALCFPDRTRLPRSWFGLLCASLLLVMLWVVVMPGLPMLLCLIPSWFLWRLYRTGNITKQVA